jgi:uncharacterized protein (DUF1501 family)
MFSRRAFLQSSPLLALAPTVPAFLARAAAAAGKAADARLLVVIQLDGGNDGINTVVPFKDDGYAKHRRRLRLPAGQLIKINDSLGLHPDLKPLAGLYDAGQLAVVQGVGYPNPSRSHFESMAVWHSARRDPNEHAGPGWLGRALDETSARPGGPVAMVHVGQGTTPPALRSRRSVAAGLTRLEDFLIAPEAQGTPTPPAEQKDDLLAFVTRMAVDARATSARMAEAARAAGRLPAYPASALARHLQLVSRLIRGEAGARIYYLRQGGYDTHSVQLGRHAALLGELARALAAFLDDLKAAKLAERVAVLCFSEFGRTVAENETTGTDHGTAGPVFVAGGAVRGGVLGATPSLLDLDPRHGDLRVGLDFRGVYATLLEGWLGLPARAVLAGRFAPLPLFRG